MKQEKYKNPNRRLLQLPGLPPNASYSYFYEFWVRPADLFRPCSDREIDDKKCDICYTAKNASDLAYAKWIDETRISRYYTCGLYKQYPGTELGYTYDWNPKNKTHIGLSEFVIKQNTNVFVNKVYTTEEYLK